MKHITKSLDSQRGMTLIGLILVAAIVGAVMITGMRVFPTVMERIAIQKIIDDLKSESSPSEVRSKFDKSAITNQISSIQGKDLIITNVNDRLSIRYAYNVEIPLLDPAYLLMKYSGQSK